MPLSCVKPSKSEESHERAAVVPAVGRSWELLGEWGSGKGGREARGARGRRSGIIPFPRSGGSLARRASGRRELGCAVAVGGQGSIALDAPGITSYRHAFKKATRSASSCG